jgi:acetyl-CoA carboxylase carboxyl transferase subunit alpha
MIFLEFEKPLEELSKRLDHLKSIEPKDPAKNQKEISELEIQINQKRKELYSNLSTWERIQVSRHPERPYTLFYSQYMCDDFIELYGDRQHKDDKAIIGGFGSINGKNSDDYRSSERGKYQNASVPKFRYATP